MMAKIPFHLRRPTSYINPSYPSNKLTVMSSILLRSSLRSGRSSGAPIASMHRSLSMYVDKLGVGSAKWSRMDPERYKEVIQTSLDQGIRLLEAGQEGGDVALNNALTSLEHVPDNNVTVLQRIGYRTLHIQHDKKKNDKDSPHITKRWDGDVTVEKQSSEDDNTQVEIVHNIAPSYLQDALSKSPLVQNTSITTIPCIHNPEVQVNHEDSNPQDALYNKLADAFQGMEEAVANDGVVKNFGVSSNGLALPPEHPLHLNYEVVLQAAVDATKRVHGNETTNPSLSILQLPVNLLEPRGMDVARDIVASSKVWPSLQVVAMRPLTYYPQGGKQQTQPMSLIDYPIPTADGTVSTNSMEGPPLVYQQALNAALCQFDGTELLEKQKSQEEPLSTLERETLEGCKLLQSILHDLDVGLEKVTSFAQHEENLYKNVIPTLYGTFEELDEDSSLVLQQFFTAYGQAVRYAIATRTRSVLNETLGEEESIPDEVTLQEFALQYVLKEPAISKVVVGCTQPSQVVENVDIAKKLDNDSKDDK